jgi:hypothetical protein
VSDLEIVDRLDAGRDAWDTLVDASPEAWLWHRFDLCAALGHWEGSTDASFAVSADGRLIAVAPLRIVRYRRLRILDVCDLESLGGVAVAGGLGRRLVQRARGHTLAQARTRVRGTPIELRMAVAPLAPGLRGPEAPRVNPLLELGFENTLTQTWMVDLRVGVDALWNGLEGRARPAVRKAHREGVTVREARPEVADLDVYLALHAATCARTGAQPHPRAYLEVIWERFLPFGLARVLFAEHDGRIVAGAQLRRLQAWHAHVDGRRHRRGRPARRECAASVGGDAAARRGGHRVGGERRGVPRRVDAKQRGLSEFKRSFGGDLRPLYRGRRDLRGRDLWGRLLLRLDALRS